MDEKKIKLIAKILLVAVLVYFAYRYYVKNYTPKGVAKAKEDSDVMTENLQVIADRLRAEYIGAGNNTCFLQYEEVKNVLVPYTAYKMLEDCKNRTEALANEIDWIDRARQTL